MIPNLSDFKVNGHKVFAVGDSVEVVGKGAISLGLGKVYSLNNSNGKIWVGFDNCYFCSYSPNSLIKIEPDKRLEELTRIAFVQVQIRQEQQKVYPAMEGKRKPETAAARKEYSKRRLAARWQQRIAIVEQLNKNVEKRDRIRLHRQSKTEN